MSGAVLKFSIPKNGKTSAANVRYITRETATHSDERNIHFHNLEQLKGKDYRETRTNFISFAESRLDDEQTRPRRGAGEARTHYRAVLSFDRNENATKANELAAKWLEDNFKDCRAAAVTHRDTKNLHIHVWVDARRLDERKLNLDKKQFRQLDESWAKIYSKEYGEHYLTDHLKKKEATRAAKREYASSKAPERKQKYKTDFKAREARNYDQSGVGIHQRNPTNEAKVLSESDRAISDSANRRQRAEREINDQIRISQRRIEETIDGLQIRAEAVSRIDKLHERSGELARGMDREQQRQQQQQQEPTADRALVRERERIRERVKE
jgi:hypothetical protein